MGLAHYIVEPNTYLGRAKERWMQSLASESLRTSESLLQATSECACVRTYVRTYLLSMRIIELNARHRSIFKN